MPFAFDLLDEEEKKKQQENQGDGAPEMTGGGESFGGGAATGAPQEKGAAKQGSGFVGLDKYMTANKGNDFGGQLTGNVQGSIDQAKGAIASGAQSFTDASNQGANKWNDVGEQIKGVIDSAGDKTSKDDVARVQNMAQGKYQGPESFYGSAYGSKALGGVQKASQQANALQSEGGRFALLDQYYGRPNYSMGEKALDNLLVQNAPGTGAKAQSIGAQAKSLANNANQTAQGLDTLAAANRQASADSAKETRDYLNSAMTGFSDDLQNRYKGYTADNDAYNQARQADISDDNLDADTMGLLGAQEGEGLYDLNLSNYLQNSQGANLGEFASDDDYSKYLALSQLAGEDPTLLRSEDRTKAGTGAGKGKIAGARDQFAKDVADRGAAYQQAAAPIQQSISDAQSKVNTLQHAYDVHYASLPTADSVTGDSQKMENTTTRQLRAALDAAKSELGGYQNQFNLLNSYMQPNRKVGKA